MIALNELIAPCAPAAFNDGVVRLPAGMPQFGQSPARDAGRKVTTKTHRPACPVEVRESGVHGHGVYATKKISRGTRIIEYTGERVSWENASGDPENPHTFLFGLENGNDVIDGEINGNEARWINHSCAPNCEARERKGQVFIYAIRNLKPGQELFYDYALEVDEPRTKELEKEYECRCGSPQCRGTMLGPLEQE
jgi:SET domain-containing protein